MKLEKIIAVRTSKTVFRDGDKCIKLFDQDHSKAKILSEAATHAKVGRSRALDVPEGARSDKGRGQVGDRLRIHLPQDPRTGSPARLPRERTNTSSVSSEAQLKINAAKAHSLEKLKDRLAESLFAADLPSATLYELHMRLESLPVGDRICHGDFAPSNLIVNGEDEDYIVDWSHAAQGVPAADAARTSCSSGSPERSTARTDTSASTAKRAVSPRRRYRKWIPLRAAERLAQGKAKARISALWWRRCRLRITKGR